MTWLIHVLGIRKSGKEKDLLANFKAVDERKNK